MSDPSTSGSEPDSPAPPRAEGVRCVIPELDRRERRMLREFATELRNRPARNIVARKALDRAADHLETAAVEYADARPFKREEQPS